MEIFREGFRLLGGWLRVPFTLRRHWRRIVFGFCSLPSYRPSLHDSQPEPEAVSLSHEVVDSLYTAGHGLIRTTG